MSHSHRTGDRRSQLKTDPVLLDIIDVLRALADESPKAGWLKHEVAAVQRLERHAAMQRLRRLQTPHSDPPNGVAQADEEGLAAFQGRHHTEDE